MPRGRRLNPLSLTPEQRDTLTSWTRRRKSAQALALRARIVLAAADGSYIPHSVTTIDRDWRGISVGRRRLRRGSS
jgi:hypothetical protein